MDVHIYHVYRKFMDLNFILLNVEKFKYIIGLIQGSRI